MDEKLLIGLDGLKAGRSHFEWHADGKFFGDFENSEILDADIDVRAEVEKSGASILVDSRVEGTVTVACDRCLADLKLPVETGFRLKVRFGEGEGLAEEDGREVITVEDRESGIDLGQILYDYVYTSLPLVRVHPDGECDPEVVKYLGGTVPEMPEASESENPFASLKTLLEKK
ncbi:MAG: DUF177 domain-containing protein [Bacteroidales bacterium]|nr:DUF177 domain-containing protein [Bacteroidales bacterium]